MRGQKTPSLEGLRVVVADDDAAVTWFLAGVLRGSGARVFEAHDGERAFELACEVSPDLVVSDIVMPGLDGFALCRAIKRDFVLRDVPVVLLSWKEDLLQRVRELGVNADGYLRKEASASAVVLRLREILRPRLRVAERLAMGGEVRGRLDGLSPRTLLALACQHRPASTLTVRDALYLYEVEIREGRPVRATRTTADGSFERGPGVLARLLGVGSGRFVVAPIVEDTSAKFPSARPDLSGTLAEQLIAPIASARAAQRLLSGASLLSVERVEIDLDLLGPVADATPEPLRSLLRSIATGASPRGLITTGKAAAHLVEDVLRDAAAHGAITAVLGEAGADLLTPAVFGESERLRGVRRPAPPTLVPSLSDILPEPAPSTPEPISAVIDRSQTPRPVALIGKADLLEGGSPRVFEQVEEAPLTPSRAPAGRVEELSISPAAVFEKVAQASPLAPKVASSRFDKAPASVGKGNEKVAQASPLAPKVASSRFDKAPASVAKGNEKAAQAPAMPAAAPARAPDLSQTIPSAPVAPVRPAPQRPVPTSLGTLIPPPVEAAPLPRAALPSAHGPKVHHEDEPSIHIRRSADSAPPSRKDGGKTKLSAWILFAVAGTVFAVGSRIAHQRAAVAPAPIVAAAEPAAPPPEPQATAAEPAPSAAPVEAPAAPRDRKEGDTADFPFTPQDLPLPKEEKVPAGQGLLEVVVGPSDAVYVDGQLAGNGPVVKTKLAPKRDPYEIRVRLRGEERVRFALVKEARLTRVRIAPPWSR